MPLPPVLRGELRARPAPPSFTSRCSRRSRAGAPTAQARGWKRVSEDSAAREPGFVRDRERRTLFDAFYRDLKHYAERRHLKRPVAPRGAGFEARAHQPYLRTPISSHHDTLAVAIK